MKTRSRTRRGRRHQLGKTIYSRAFGDEGQRLFGGVHLPTCSGSSPCLIWRYFCCCEWDWPRKFSCCLLLSSVVSCCLLLSSVVSCCLLLSPVVFCCLLLSPVVSCCLLLSPVVSCCLLLCERQSPSKRLHTHSSGFHVCKDCISLQTWIRRETNPQWDVTRSLLQLRHIHVALRAENQCVCVCVWGGGGGGSGENAETQVANRVAARGSVKNKLPPQTHVDNS